MPLTVMKTRHLLERARIHLALYDEDGFRGYLLTHWPGARLTALLDDDDGELARVACLGLALLQEDSSVPALISALSQEDAVLVSTAEFALWTIWFGQQGAAARRDLQQALHAEITEAGRALDELIRRFPDWAEAYNQRAIVSYKGRHFISAIDYWKEALDLEPQHFGALAGLAHAFAQIGCYQQALSLYRQALCIHPRMAGIRQSIRTVQDLLHQAAHA